MFVEAWGKRACGCRGEDGEQARSLSLKEQVSVDVERVAD